MPANKCQTGVAICTFECRHLAKLVPKANTTAIKVPITSAINFLCYWFICAINNTCRKLSYPLLCIYLKSFLNYERFRSIMIFLKRSLLKCLGMRIVGFIEQQKKAYASYRYIITWENWLTLCDLQYINKWYKVSIKVEEMSLANIIYEQIENAFSYFSFLFFKESNGLYVQSDWLPISYLWIMLLNCNYS